MDICWFYPVSISFSITCHFLFRYLSIHSFASEEADCPISVSRTGFNYHLKQWGVILLFSLATGLGNMCYRTAFPNSTWFRNCMAKFGLRHRRSWKRIFTALLTGLSSYWGGGWYVDLLSFCLHEGSGPEDGGGTAEESWGRKDSS